MHSSASRARKMEWPWPTGPQRSGHVPGSPGGRSFFKLDVEPEWCYFGTMPVNLSIKNVPDSLAKRLRRRAKTNRRSLQNELLCIIEEAVETGENPEKVLRELRELGVKTPTEATAILRAERDGR